MDIFSELIIKSFPKIDIYTSTFHVIDPSINFDVLDFDFVFEMCKRRHKFRSKFYILNRFAIDNLFIDDEKREKILLKFSKCQRTYSALCKLAYIFKMKRAIVGSTDTDMEFNKLNTLPNSIKITMFDKKNNTVYNFRISDLIKIIENALTYAPYFFAEPFMPKNPYNNIQFTKNQLYMIYLKYKQSSYKSSVLFDLFVESKFDLHTFKNVNECILRNKILKNFYDNCSFDEKIRYVDDLYSDFFDLTKVLKIHHDFPDKTYVKAFEPILFDYLIYTKSLTPSYKIQARAKILVYLKRFIKFNPLFGRRVERKLTDILHRRIILSDTTINFYAAYQSCLKSFGDYYFIDYILDEKTYYQRNTAANYLRNNYNLDLNNNSYANILSENLNILTNNSYVLDNSNTNIELSNNNFELSNNDFEISNNSVSVDISNTSVSYLLNNYLNEASSYSATTSTTTVATHAETTTIDTAIITPLPNDYDSSNNVIV